MIVQYLDVGGVLAVPAKDHAPLVVDRDGLEPGEVARQSVQAIAGRVSQVVKDSRGVQHLQLAARALLNILREALIEGSAEGDFSALVGKAFDHSQRVALSATKDNTCRAS